MAFANVSMLVVGDFCMKRSPCFPYFKACSTRSMTHLKTSKI